MGLGADRLQGDQSPLRQGSAAPDGGRIPGEDLKVGFYHSVIDWHHPEFTVDPIHPMRDDLEYREAHKDRDIRKYAEYLHGQTRELLTQFGKISVLWYDFSYAGRQYPWGQGKGRDDWQSEKLVKLVRELSRASSSTTGSTCPARPM